MEMRYEPPTVNVGPRRFGGDRLIASDLPALGLMSDPAADPDAKLFQLLDDQVARNAD